MTLLVPFDGSALSKAALERAVEFGEYREEEIVALTVVPTDAEFAEERGWINPGAEYDPEAVCADFETQVQAVAPDVQFQCEHPAESQSMTATVIDDVTRCIRQVADELEASIIFIGSENAGRVSTPVTSVGSPISEDPHYDVHIVRHA